MADDITDKCSRLQLRPDSDDVLDFSADNLEDNDVKIGWCLVVKLLTKKPINIDDLKRTMNIVWNLENWKNISEKVKKK